MKAAAPFFIAISAFGIANADVFDNLADYSLSVQNDTLINFDTDPEGNPLSQGQIGNTYSSLGVEFEAGNYIGVPFATVSGPYSWFNDTAFGDTGRFFSADFTVSGITAVGVFNIRAGGGGITELTAWNSAGEALGSAFGDGNIDTADFFGLTTDEDIARITITFLNQNGWGLDDLHFGSAVPSPGVLAMVGFGSLAGFRRRR